VTTKKRSFLHDLHPLHSLREFDALPQAVAQSIRCDDGELLESARGSLGSLELGVVLQQAVGLKLGERNDRKD
jgi:hypothetical protein